MLENNILYSYSDITLNESDGEYIKVKELFEKEVIKSTEWMIETRFSIEYSFGLADFNLHFYSDKSIVIIEYIPSTGMSNSLFSQDLSYLYQWANEKGWSVPSVTDDLVKQNLVFWKHYWDTHLIDSNYFYKKYGDRDIIEDE